MQILYGYIICKSEIHHRGNTCAQIFTDREVFLYVHPMQSKSQYGETLNVVTRDIGIPNTLISHNSGGKMGPQT